MSIFTQHRRGSGIDHQTAADRPENPGPLPWANGPALTRPLTGHPPPLSFIINLFIKILSFQFCY
jgi:hypothetical protein